MTRGLATTARVLLAAALLAGAAYMLTQTTRLLLDGPKAAPISAAANAPQLTPPSPTTVAITKERVLAWQLFGAYQATDTLPTAQTAPESNLDITLLGVFRGGSDTTGWAIIRTDGGQDKTYQVGDRIAPGVTIASLGTGKILVRREGRREALSLPEWGGLQGIAAVSRDADQDTASSKAGQKPPPKGLVISSNRMGIARKLGLKKGDVLISINGYTMRSKGSLVLAMKSMQKASLSTITIKRGGKRLTRRYTPR